MSEDRIWDIMFGLVLVGLPIVLIIGGFIRGMFNRWLSYKERVSTMVSEDLVKEVASLRAELRQLRDTSTQYDMSLQQVLDEVNRRLDTLERRSHKSQPPGTDTTQLRIGK